MRTSLPEIRKTACLAGLKRRNPPPEPGRNARQGDQVANSALPNVLIRPSLSLSAMHISPACRLCER